jgi:hypothetical protein
MVQLNSGVEPSARTLRGMPYQLSPHAEADYMIAWRSQPGISDVRESLAFPIMSELLKRGAIFKAFDQ